MDQRELKQSKELNRLLAEKLSEAYNEMARMRANNSHQEERNQATAHELQQKLESAEAKSEKYQRKVASLQQKLDKQKRQKTQLRIELNRMRAKMERISNGSISSKITLTDVNQDWSTGEQLKNSISKQAKITPQSVFKVSPCWMYCPYLTPGSGPSYSIFNSYFQGIYAHPLRSVDLGSVFGSTGLVSSRRLEKLKRRETAKWTRMKKVKRLVDRPLDLAECFPPQEPRPINSKRRRGSSQ